MCSGLHISAVTYTAKLLLSQGNAIAKVRSLIMNLNIKQQNCPFPWRDPSPHLIRDSLGPLNSLFQTACQLGQSYFCSSPETMHILYNGAGHAPPQIANSRWFLGLTRVQSPNGISIVLAVFVGLTLVTNRHSDRQTTEYQ